MLVESYKVYQVFKVKIVDSGQWAVDSKMQKRERIQKQKNPNSKIQIQNSKERQNARARIGF